MWWKLSGLVAALLIAVAPAAASPCKTQGNVDEPIKFPRNDANDVPIARSMIPIIFPEVTSALRAALTCTRSTISTPIGDYVLGGENDDPISRLAVRADGQPGPAAYLAHPPTNPGLFALVVHFTDSLTVVEKLYAGIPTDQRLAEDVRKALTQKSGIMSFDAAQRAVRYGFTPRSGIPMPVQPGQAANGGTTIAAGPQILVQSTGDPQMLDMARGMQHRPSGFACPKGFEGLAILLMTIDPRTDYLSCRYRSGTDLHFRPTDQVRYVLTLVRAPPAITTRNIFDQITTKAHATLHITGDHVPPLAGGPAPAPELVACWDTDGGTEGVWVGKVGDWTMWVQFKYPPSAANDAEAAQVAKTLFVQAHTQIGAGASGAAPN